MNILTIPVSPFTRKVILSTHGHTEPITLRAADTLTGALCCIKPGDATKFDKPKASLTTTISVTMNANLARHVHAKRLWRVGLHLDDIYRKDLNNYVKAKVEEGIFATTAIHQFCEDHDIELDIDINSDTLYKDWQRFNSAQNENNSAIFHRQKQRFVRRVGENSAMKHPHVQLFTDTELDAIISQYVEKNASLFRTTRGTMRKKLRQQLELYVYRAVGNRTPQYVCRKFALTKAYTIRRHKTPQYKPRTDYDSRLRYAVRSFKIFLNTAPPIVL